MDKNGNLYFRGYTTGSLVSTKGGLYDTYCGAIDQNGNTIWAKQFGENFNTAITSAAGDEYGGNLIPDSNGNFVMSFMLINSNFAEPFAGGYDIGLVKFKNDGTILSTKHFGTETSLMAGADHSKEDYISLSGYDKNDAAYLTGYSNGSIADTNAGGKDIL